MGYTALNEVFKNFVKIVSAIPLKSTAKHSLFHIEKFGFHMLPRAIFWAFSHSVSRVAAHILFIYHELTISYNNIEYKQRV